MSGNGEPRRFVLDTKWHDLRFGADRQLLTPLETRLLCALLKQPGQPLPRTELAEALWGRVVEGAAGRLDVHVHNLRSKLRRLTGESALIERRASALRFDPGKLPNAEIVIR